MRNRGLTALVAVAVVGLCLGLASTPAQAGRWVLQYTPNAAISVKLDGDELVGIVNPTFGPGRAGKLELRLAGVAVKQFENPPYLFRIPVLEPVIPLRIKGQEKIMSFRIEPGLDYSLEAFVVQSDDRRKSAAPATTFRLEEETVVAAPGSPSVGLSEEQLKKLLKEAYDEGFRRGQASVPTHNPGPAELRPVAPSGKVMVRLWDKKGLPTNGVVLIKFQGGEKRLEVHGQATVDVPVGQVSIQAQVRPGRTSRNPGWILAEGQKPEVKVQIRQTVTWDLYKEEAR